MELCRPGEPVDLIPEPKNPADPNAVAIYSCRGVQLGYVTAERAPLVRSWLASGREVKSLFQGLSPTGAWIRVGIDGEEAQVEPSASTALPHIQARSERSTFDPDAFYPDPIYED